MPRGLRLIYYVIGYGYGSNGVSFAFSDIHGSLWGLRSASSFLLGGVWLTGFEFSV